MTWANSSRSLQLALGLVAPMVTLVTIDLPRTQAQPVTATSDVRFIPPQPPDQGTASGRRRGAASRCNGCNLPLTALVPGDQERSPVILTVAEHPTFWFYVPRVLTSELPGEFVLQDAADNNIYKTTVTTLGTPEDMVSIALPQQIRPLEIGKQYHWTFWIRSDPKAASSYVAVDGLVQRVVPNPQLLNQLKQVTPRERTALYAAHGIWCEALTTLAELRRQNPQDATLTAEWISLLHSVGLDDIATKAGTELKNALQHSDAIQRLQP